MEIKDILSNNVKALRIARGSTLVEFAQELQISKSTLQKIEMTGNTTIATISWMATTLGISPEELLLNKAMPKTLSTMQWLLQGTDTLSHLSPEKRKRIIYHLIEIDEDLNDE